MDKQIEARFDRVEKALGSLVESIAKYNPSIPLAHELAIADEELTKGLREGKHAMSPCSRSASHADA